MSADPCHNLALYAFHSTTSPPRSSLDRHSVASSSNTSSSPPQTSTNSVRRLFSSGSPTATRTSSGFWGGGAGRRNSVFVVNQHDQHQQPDQHQPSLNRAASTSTPSLPLMMMMAANGESGLAGGRRPPLPNPRPITTTASMLFLDKDLPKLPDPSPSPSPLEEGGRPLPPIITTSETPTSEVSLDSKLRVTPASSDAAPSVSFALPRSGQNANERRPSVRRVRSTFVPAAESTVTQSDTEGERKKRRMSIGEGVVAALFGAGGGGGTTGGQEKGKEREEAQQITASVTEPGLTRKSSFWSRRKRKDSTPSSAPPAQTTNAPPPPPPSMPQLSRPSTARHAPAPKSLQSQPASTSHTRQRSHSFAADTSISASVPTLPSFHHTPLFGESFTDTPLFLTPDSGAQTVSSDDAGNNYFPNNTQPKQRKSSGFFRTTTSPRGSMESQTRNTTRSVFGLLRKSEEATSVPSRPSSSHDSSRAITVPGVVAATTGAPIALGSLPCLPTTTGDVDPVKPWEAYEHAVIHEGEQSTFGAVSSLPASATLPMDKSRPSGLRSRTMSLRRLVGANGSAPDLRVPNASASASASNSDFTTTPSTPTNGGDVSVPITRTPSGASSLSSRQHASQTLPVQPAPTARQLGPPPPPNSSTFKSRKRASTHIAPLTTNTGAGAPLIRRLSQHFFPPSSPTLAGTSTSLPGSRRPAMSRKNSTSVDGHTTTTAVSEFGAGTTTVKSAPVAIPKPMVELETPEKYLARLLEAVSKQEIASVLASSGDDFHQSALRAYVSRFDFTSDPLDVALRKLLMDLSLPKETQQIDRVMESFAKRYEECNPGLFLSEDHPYILAFSLMMLHTDAFNKSNKRKMTKADYIKNTRLPGVPPEVLDCFYDNIVFAPFIFIEDPMDVNGQRGFVPEGQPVLSSVSALGGPGVSTGGVSPAMGVGGSSMFGQVKIDPYYLITKRLLVPLRANVEAEVPQFNPYLYTGTVGAWDESKLQRAFAEAEAIEIANPSFANGRKRSVFSSADDQSADATIVLKMTKFGVLHRKEDLLDGGRRSGSRKWREWSVLLTGSQMLFFRDPWLASDGGDANANGPRNVNNVPPSRRLMSVQPDEILSLNDAIALFDTAYNKYPHAFRLLMPGGAQYLMLAPSKDSMNEWISLINYASAFKTAGLRMRPPGMTEDQARSAGTAAAMSHANDVKRRRLSSFTGLSPRTLQRGPSTTDLHTTPSPSDPERTLYSSSVTANNSSVSVVGAGSVNGTGTGTGRRRPNTANTTSLELESPTLEPSDGRLEDTFFEVKAELAALEAGSGPAAASTKPIGMPIMRTVSLGTFPPNDEDRRRISSEEPDSSGQLRSPNPRRGSRSIVVSAKLKDLESKISTVQSSLDADIRIARNLAVLTPFQQSTRNRILLVLPPLAKRVNSMRMTIAKLVCHRDVLYSDLAAEEREWRDTLSVAFEAGAEFLKKRNGVDGLVGLDSSAVKAKPSMQSLVHESASSPSSPPVTVLSPPMMSPELGASIPAVTVEIDSAPLSNMATPGHPEPIPFFSNYKINAESSSSTPDDGMLAPNARSSIDDPEPSPSASSFGPPSEPGEAEDNAVEQAEDWDKTKAAKRVSLAQLPSDRKLSALGLMGRLNHKQGPAPPVLDETTVSSNHDE